MDEIYIPTLHSFAMENRFSGSCGDFRFLIVPEVVKNASKAVVMEESSITAEYWHGPFSYEHSQIEAKKSFPMTDEGRLELQKWLMDNV